MSLANLRQRLFQHVVLPLQDERTPMRAKMFVVALAVVSTACGVSQQQEIEIGQSNVQQINPQLPIVNDPEVNRYINVLGDSIARLTSRADLPWHFYIVNSSEVNAFAVPGGYIYVNRGLIERAQTHGSARGRARPRDRTRGAAALGQADGAACRARTSASTLACVLTSVCNSGVGQAAINVGGTRALRQVQPRRRSARRTRRASTNVVRARHQPEGHSRRCSRSCSTSGTSNPRRVETGSRRTRSKKTASRTRRR